jgi:hypothetical protein
MRELVDPTCGSWWEVLAPIKVHTYKLFEENYKGTSETNTPNSNKTHT